MFSTKKIELSGGIGTLMFAIVNCFNSFVESNRAKLGVWDYLFVILVWIILPIVIAIGSYVHAVEQKSWGLTMLFIGGVFSTLALVYITFLIGVSNRIAILSIMPSVMAILTMLYALLIDNKKIA